MKARLCFTRALKFECIQKLFALSHFRHPFLLRSFPQTNFFSDILNLGVIKLKVKSKLLIFQLQCSIFTQYEIQPLRSKIFRKNLTFISVG